MPGVEPKPPWRHVPEQMRRDAENMLGAQITRAIRIWGGYSPSATFRLFLSDGRKAVFKGVSAASNDVMREALDSEERVYSELSSIIGRWAPAFFGALRHADWHALLIEDVGPAQVPPWTPEYAAVALRDYAAFHAASLGVTALPEWLPRDRHLDFSRTWRELAAEDGGLDGTAGLAGERAIEARAWLGKHLADLQRSAERLVEVEAPHAVLHFDTRSDNLRIQADGRLRLFDWPFTCLGPPEFDMAAFVQSIHVEGGPTPEECVGWYIERLEVREVALVGSVSAMAGYFADRAWRPDIPGLPRVRSIQRRQLRGSLNWWARLHVVAEPEWLAAVPD